MNASTISPKWVKPCRGIATVIIVTGVVTLSVLVALILTVFRPRDPTFTIYLVGLRGLNVVDFLRSENLTTGIVIGVSNENYGSVSWRNLTVLVELPDDDRQWWQGGHVRGAVVGEIPIPGGILSQRSTMNITTNATLQLDKLRADLHNVLVGLQNGGLNFTCSVTASGEVRPFNVLPRIRGSISVECFGSVYINRTPVPGIGVFDGQAWCWTVKKRVVM
ncbi:hypothetical protein LINGRAHAP2_LOCUS18857 [Linum grandiflorum]